MQTCKSENLGQNGPEFPGLYTVKAPNHSKGKGY